jgi:phosphoribosylaminoimidazole-succinocarboxamide synthase
MNEIEGKTKIITPHPDNKYKIIIKTKDSLSGGDGAKKDTIKNIGKQKTKQTSNVFQLLNSYNIPTAFIKQQSSNEIICYDCEMLPIEWVVRRYAWGSYLITHPELKKYKQPYRIPGLPVYEMFHKNTVIASPITDTPYQTSENEARELFLKDGKWAKGVYTDPLIKRHDDYWELYPRLENQSTAKPIMKIDPIIPNDTVEDILHELVLTTFDIIDSYWYSIVTKDGPITLVDMKIEIGKRRSDRKYVVADVIDNDSWRIWPGKNPDKQLDKQCFRDDYAIDKVADNYSLVTELTQKFNI